MNQVFAITVLCEGDEVATFSAEDVPRKGDYVMGDNGETYSILHVVWNTGQAKNDDVVVTGVALIVEPVEEF